MSLILANQLKRSLKYVEQNKDSTRNRTAASSYSQLNFKAPYINDHDIPAVLVRDHVPETVHAHGSLL